MYDKWKIEAKMLGQPKFFNNVNVMKDIPSQNKQKYWGTIWIKRDQRDMTNKCNV